MTFKSFLLTLFSSAVLILTSSSSEASTDITATGFVKTVQQNKITPLYHHSFDIAMGKAEKKKPKRATRSRTKARSKEMEKYRQKQLKLIRKKRRNRK